MSIRFATDEEDEVIVLRITLNAATGRRLRAIADDAHCFDEVIASAILHDVLLDDELAHKCDLSPTPANENETCH